MFQAFYNKRVLPKSSCKYADYTPFINLYVPIITTLYVLCHKR